MNNTEEFYTIVLAALLHDIGKFYLCQNLCDEFKNVKLKGHGHAKWSACFIRKKEQVLKNVPDLIDMVLYHGQPGKQKNYNEQSRDENKILKALLISIADKLSSKERRKEEEAEVDEEEEKEKAERCKIPLLSVFNEINLGLHSTKQKKAYSLKPLAAEKEILFPKLNYPNEKLQEDAYPEMCRQLNEEFDNIKNSDYITISHLLYKYLWASPSATPLVGITPDVSLYDHARTTAAIALCLYKNYKLWLSKNKNAEKLHNALREDFLIKIGEKSGPLSEGYKTILNDPLFILLAGDMFGIQDYIYTPSNIPGTSKRLRARSFYLLMLTEIIARYIIYHPDINLPLVNILYCAGGNFQILLPKTDEIISTLRNILKGINKDLYNSFQGKLGFVFAMEEISSFDFDIWDEVLKRVDDKITLEKKKKMQDGLKENQGDILFPKDEIVGRKDICKSCGDTISYSEEDEEKICDFCKRHKEMGEKLPRTIAIVFHQGDGKVESINNNNFSTYEIDFGCFGKVTLIYKTNEGVNEKPSLKISGVARNIEYYKLNDTKEFVNSAFFENAIPSFGFKFLGNAVPFDDDGSVMEFEKISEKSEGAKKLGILKMDVDLLGLIMQIGLSSKDSSDRTISRLATLSRMMELYFSGYINRICEAEEFKNKIYIVFSGGDDLFLIGPWSKIPLLAKKVYDDFREYTCENPNITLSGGIFICDPKFPVKRFAYLVKDELKASKEGGRDRCTVFGETVPWQKNTHKQQFSFDELIKFAEKLTEWLEKGKIARGFLHELLEIHHLYFSDAKKCRVLYRPQLLWQIIRNVKDEDVRSELFIKFINSIDGIKWLENVKIPVSYALLKSRR
jgi:CRISPR-associated protein Csm1